MAPRGLPCAPLARSWPCRGSGLSSSGRAGEQHASPSPRNSASAFPPFNSKTLVTQSCSEVKNSSCARRKQRGSTKMAAVLALAEGLKKSAPFHQSKYSSRLSETPLYERTGFAVNWHVHPHWSRLIAWSRPSSHWQHRRRRPSYKFILNPPSRWGQSFAAGSTRLPPTQADLCSWGDKGPAPPPRRRRGAPPASK